MTTLTRSLALSVALAASAFALPAAAAVDGPKVSWNYAVWGPKRSFTAGMEAVAAYVEKETGGKFTIKMNYGGALSKPNDTLDNIKLGSFEIAQICVGYHPGKNPAVTVLDLPGLPLADPEVHWRVHDVVYQHPAILAEFKKWDAKPYLSVIQPQSEIMGTGAPPVKMEDFSGMRVRALGGTGEALKNLGAVPTSVPAPEVYNGIERGVFRAVAFPYTYAFASYKIDEVGKWYTTNLAPGSNTCPTVMSLTAYGKLPKQYQQLLDGAHELAYKALIAANDAADKANLAKWQAANLQAIVYSDAELKKFVEKGAKPVWGEWVKENSAKGIPAQELLDLTLAEAAKVKKQLGKK